MKKRILAFALTLAMVITSVSMLSFVSFAEGETEPEAPAVVAEDFYAYRASAIVDSKLGADELYVPVQRKVAPNVGMGVAWDYENVYVILYQEPATNGVPGARKDYLENAKINVGGVEIEMNWADASFTAPEGSAAFGKLGGNYDVEFAVPLSEITLDAEALAAGKLVVPMTMDINTMVGETSTLTAKAFNLVLTGRSLISQLDDVNPVSGANNIVAFNGGHVYDRGAAKFNPITSGFTQTGGKDSAWKVKDESTYAGKLEVLRMFNEVDEYVSINDGGKSYYEFEFNIANLPAGAVTTYDTITSFKNQVSHIQIHTGGAHATVNRGLLAVLYNDPTNGLSLAYYNGTSTTTNIDLGVELGETFVLGFNEVTGGNNQGTFEFYVNDKLVATYSGSLPAYTLTGDCGGGYVCYKRGAANNFSLDMDANGTVDADEIVEFSMTGFVLANVADVDVATVASLTKNGGTPTPTVLTTYTAPKPETAANVASMSEVYSYYDYDGAMLYVAVGTANIDRYIVNAGGAIVEMTGFTFKDLGGAPNPATPHINPEAAAKGITVSTATRINQYTIVGIPLELIYVQENEAGEAFCDLSVEVIKEDQVIQNPGKEDEKIRVKNVTSGTWDGTLVFDRAVSRSFKATLSNHSVTVDSVTKTSYAGFTSTNAAVANVTNAGNSLEFANSPLNTTVRNGAYIIGGNMNCLSGYGTRTITFDAKFDHVTAYDFSANGGYSAFARPHSATGAAWSDVGVARAYERLSLAYHGNNSVNGTQQAALAIEFVRDTNDGLVILHTGTNGVVTPIVLGDEYLGQNVTYKIVWNTDETGEFYVNGNLVKTISSAMSTVTVPKGTGCFVSGNVTGGLISIDFIKSNAPGGAMSYEWTAQDIMAKASAYDLSIPFAQLAYVQETAVTNNTYSIRLVALMNTIEASKAGFEVSVNGADNVTTYATTTVYNSFWQKVDGERTLVEAPNGTNFLTAVIPMVEATTPVETPEVDVPVEGGDAADPAPVNEGAAEPETEPVTVTYIVKPFFVSGGETTYGNAYEITYVGGEFIGATIVK